MKIPPALSNINKQISDIEELLAHLQDYSLLNLYLDEINSLKEKLPCSCRIFTREELLYDYNGQNGKPLYLSTCHYVFNVTHHPLWHSTHFPSLQLGQCPLDYFQLYYQNDITSALEAGPIVGKLLHI